jgi:hypothetical protein
MKAVRQWARRRDRQRTGASFALQVLDLHPTRFRSGGDGPQVSD